MSSYRYVDRILYGDERDEELRFLGMRVTNLGANVHTYCERTGNGSSNHDLCEGHAKHLDHNPHRFDEYLKPGNSDEPQGEDGWGGEVEHEPYGQCNYRCAIPSCRVLLGD